MTPSGIAAGGSHVRLHSQLEMLDRGRMAFLSQTSEVRPALLRISAPRKIEDKDPIEADERGRGRYEPIPISRHSLLAGVPLRDL
jgi:hypothetical protein